MVSILGMNGIIITNFLCRILHIQGQIAHMRKIIEQSIISNKKRNFLNTLRQSFLSINPWRRKIYFEGNHNERTYSSGYTSRKGINLFLLFEVPIVLFVRIFSS
ncbi:unnamed protein product [Vicia faba]|uniref:Uncharacterized protein n=1 Tax=Vicia faba TaxID=3906 RepID=A0AAV1AIC2_VICFA|nr:unnamed protein product [Vicia faba]